MVGKPGPFQIIDAESGDSSPHPIAAPRRRYECTHYETCLNIAAALNWDSFTCRGCSGEVEQTLFWRARQASKRDAVVSTLCNIPAIECHSTDEPPAPTRKRANED